MNKINNISQRLEQARLRMVNPVTESARENQARLPAHKELRLYRSNRRLIPIIREALEKASKSD